MKQWTAARQQDIEEAYNDSASWTTLDEITRSHNYSFSSIADWPVDGCLICAPTEKSALLLGSLQAACNLSALKEDLGFSVPVVVSMCDAEMKVHGAPANWTAYFNQHNVFHIRCQLDDLTVKQPKRSANEYKALQDECLWTWKNICFQLWQQSLVAELMSLWRLCLHTSCSSMFQHVPALSVFHAQSDGTRVLCSLACQRQLTSVDYGEKEGNAVEQQQLTLTMVPAGIDGNWIQEAPGSA
eukprot:s13_g5.t1